jgi:hypothetical protein
MVRKMGEGNQETLLEGQAECELEVQKVLDGFTAKKLRTVIVAYKEYPARDFCRDFCDGAEDPDFPAIMKMFNEGENAQTKREAVEKNLSI